MAETSILRVSEVTKSFGSKRVLAGIDLDVREGDSLAIVGPSGAGKSTLLSVLGLLMTPDSGRCWWNDEEVSRASAGHRAALRNVHLGFVFQQFHLVKRITVRENVALPLTYARIPRGERGPLVDKALDRVGLLDQANQGVQTLSGGEQQRVAIARALVLTPRLLLCDEPTGNLDPANAASIIKLVTDHAASGNASIVITHDATVAASLGRKLSLSDGLLV